MKSEMWGFSGDYPVLRTVSIEDYDSTGVPRVVVSMSKVKHEE